MSSNNAFTQTELFLNYDCATHSPPHSRPVRAAINPSPGRLLDRYTLTEILGTGIDGAVWLAIDETLARIVAVKLPINPDAADRCRREARILAALDHANIVPVLDASLDGDDAPFFVMKHIRGCNLREQARSEEIGWRETVDLGVSIADALHHAHQRGIVHRDVKPANILVDRPGKFCLADFGLALTGVRQPTKTDMSGTPAYMSPEQAIGRPVDRRSDIFSLGTVLYELLTGERPFGGNTMAETLRCVASHTPLALRDGMTLLPDELKRICARALAKSPQDRYSDAAELAADLERTSVF